MRRSGLIDLCPNKHSAPGHTRSTAGWRHISAKLGQGHERVEGHSHVCAPLFAIEVAGVGPAGLHTCSNFLRCPPTRSINEQDMDDRLVHPGFKYVQEMNDYFRDRGHELSAGKLVSPLPLALVTSATDARSINEMGSFAPPSGGPVTFARTIVDWSREPVFLPASGRHRRIWRIILRVSTSENRVDKKYLAITIG